MTAWYLMQTLIGSAQSFSAGAPGSGMYSRAMTNMMQQHEFVDNASSFNSHFSDSGIFGISIEGPGSHSAELYSVLVDEFARLKEPIHEQELNRAKNILKMNVMNVLENPADRLQEIARNYKTDGTFTFHQYIEKIDAVTSDQINRAATAAFAGKPTMLVQGGAVNLVPNVTDVNLQLK